MNFKIFPFLSILIWALSANAQTKPDNRSYLITKTNDTLYGRIKMNIFTGTKKLLTTEGSYKIDSDQYLAYYDQKQRSLYRSKLLPGVLPEKLKKKLSMSQKPEWLKCLEDGEIVLYEQKHYTYGNTPDHILGMMTTFSSIIVTGGIPNSEFTSWYVEKEGYPLTLLKHNTFASIDGTTRRERRGLLQNLTIDQLSEEKCKSNSFSFETIQTLIHKYNAKHQPKT